MKDYKKSDYALNRRSKGIVYRFADGVVTITLDDYLAENPGMTEQDFRELKALSDAIYYEQDRGDNAQTGKNTPYDESEDNALCFEASPETIVVGGLDALDEADRQRQRLDAANRALGRLTETQRRRYLLYAVEGLSVQEIAARESVSHQSVSESIAASEKKLNLFFKNSQKHPAKTP